MSLPIAVNIIGGFNECVNFLQWARSAASYLRSQWNTTQEQKLHEDDILQLKSEVERLSETLPAMYNLIDRAEWRTHELYVAELLPKLKDAVYDAEDLLDEIKWYELKVVAEGSTNPLSPLDDFFHSVTQGSFNKVTVIQKRLNNLSTDLEKMGLHQATPRFDKLVRPETSSFPNEPKIFGRDKELRDLITLLGVQANSNVPPCKRKRTRSGGIAIESNQVCTTLDDNNNEVTITCVPVLPIVGIGGVGKTTLAQNICNHRQVTCHFDLITWICVSDDFDVKRLTEEVIQSYSIKVTTTDNLDSLQRKLAGVVMKKRFLLILDDMWDDALREHGHCWRRFCAPFTNVMQGSMMLVTTRSQEVANLVRTMDPYPLEGLKDDVFWDFFRQCIFGFDDYSIDPELECIGKNILPKLRGSPLAAKTLGRLLGMNHDVTHWNNILRSELWELRQMETDILPALRLSYIYLPLHLKRCFSICALYLKDHRFTKESLAQIWVAEGFVAPQSNIALHDIGCQYFEDLVNRSFFQTCPYDDSSYVIHDLMHDMAQLVSKDECFIIKDSSDIQKLPQNIRHLSIQPTFYDFNPYNLSILDKYRKLRSLFCHMPNSDTSILERWCAQFQCMRVLCLNGIEKLPNTISTMKHLRYLRIDWSFLKRLPSEVCCLYHLQTIDAQNCKFDNFPSGLFLLSNLQTFQSHGYQFHQGHAVHDACVFHDIPNGFGTEINNLQVFESITYRFDQGCAVYCREGATNGQGGKFRFDKISSESLPIWFRPKYFPIVSLSFNHCHGLKSIPLSRNSQSIHPNEISAGLVDNMGSITSTFSSLIDVSIESCGNLSSLEQFLQPAYIPGTKRIVIADCPSLEFVPTERFGDLSFLEELKVCNCPKINSRRLFAPSLKKLELENSGNLGDNIQCCSLTCLQLSHPHRVSINLNEWNLPVLEELYISFCLSLESIMESSEEPISDLTQGNESHRGARRSIIKFSKLTHLTIAECYKLKTFDDLLLSVPAIESISIEYCNCLSLPTERFGRFPFLKILILLSCQRLNWESGLVLPSSLRKLKLWSCGDFSNWFPSCVENLTSLESLEIGFCKRIVSIPGNLWSSNLKTLKDLRIACCPDLESIGESRSIIHIEKVLVEHCPKLKSLRRGDWSNSEDPAYHRLHGWTDW